jgi:peptidyl-prolyl cis-trans isomerase SurA
MKRLAHSRRTAQPERVANTALGARLATEIRRRMMPSDYVRLVPSALAGLLPAAVTAVILACVRPTAAVAQEVVDQVVASVDGEPITEEDVREYARRRGVALPPDNLGTSQAFHEALRGTIDERLFQEELKSVSGDVDDTMVDRYIKSINAQNHISDQELQAALRANKLSYEEFRNRAREQVEKMVLIQREVRGKITIPDDQIRAYYKSHQAEFIVKEERYRIAQILIATDEHSSTQDIVRARGRAMLIRTRLSEGQNFTDLAEKFSDDPSKSNGGDLGWFKPDELLDQIRDAVSQMKVGEISQVVQTPHGFHILKLEDHEKPGLRPLPEVRDQIESALIMQRLDSEFKRWLRDDLAKKHVVETNLPR